MTDPSRNVHRRRLLQGFVAAGVGATLGVRGLQKATAQDPLMPDTTRGRVPDGYEPWQWDDPNAWPGGQVPGSGDVAQVLRPIMVDGDRVVAGIDIAPQGALVFAPHADAQINTRGNVVVRGRLTMRPDTGVATHTLRFIDVDESRYVGGHAHQPPDTDVGLWVLGRGVLDAVGTAKLPWARVGRDLTAGATVLDLPVDPDGWVPGDELVLTPTLPGEANWDAFDRARIASVTGRRVMLETPLTYDHPVFAHAAISQDIGAYVVNLTRDVKVEGTPDGKAHVMFLHTVEPQHVSHTELAHLAPMQGEGDDRTGVVGRYALHMHMCFNGSEGSRMVGLSAHDLGGHAFVSHLSNGIDWVACTVHDNFSDQFWWDTRGTSGGGPGDDHPPSHDVRYIQCLGSRRRSARGAGKSWRNPVFNLLEGEGNAAIGCVAVGTWGTGFHWPEGSQGVWDFRDCVAMACRDSGISSWQNSRRRHVVERFLVARCGGDGGIQHGAYSNMYLYRDALVAECDGAPLLVHAANRAATWDQEFRNVYFDASEMHPYAVEGVHHNSDRPHVMHNDCTYTGYTSHAFGHVSGSENPMRARIDRYKAADSNLSEISDANRALGSEHLFVQRGAGASLAGLAFPVSAWDPAYENEINRQPPDGPVVRSYEMDADDGTNGDTLVCRRHPHQGGGLVRLQPGDTLLAFYMSDSSQIPPAGFRLLTDASIDDYRRFRTYRKTVTDNEPDEYVWRQEAAMGRHGVVMVCVSGTVGTSSARLHGDTGTLFRTPQVAKGGLAVCFFARPGIGEIDIDQNDVEPLTRLVFHSSSVSSRPAFMVGFRHDVSGSGDFGARALTGEDSGRFAAIVNVV